MSNVFLYTVNPRRTINGLSGSTKVVRTPKSLFLSKEDVYLCLKNASVYRRFANEGINEKVTIDNVDRVHREKYIPESEWAAFVAKEKSSDHATVAATNNVSNHHIEEKTVEAAETNPVKDENVETTEINNDDLDKSEVIESDDETVVEKVEDAE